MNAVVESPVRDPQATAPQPAVADTAAAVAVSATADDTATPQVQRGKQVEVFYDGDCPLCKREIDLLRWMDGKERVQFTDIAAEGFEPSAYGKTMDELMAEIHGRLPSGEWIIGVEVFRRLYAAVGFAWAVPATRAPGVRHALDLGYRFFAKQRLRLTGRCHDGACDISR